MPLTDTDAIQFPKLFEALSVRDSFPTRATQQAVNEAVIEAIEAACQRTRNAEVCGPDEMRALTATIKRLQSVILPPERPNLTGCDPVFGFTPRYP